MGVSCSSTLQNQPSCRLACFLTDLEAGHAVSACCSPGLLFLLLHVVRSQSQQKRRRTHSTLTHTCTGLAGMPKRGGSSSSNTTTHAWERRRGPSRPSRFFLRFREPDDSVVVVAFGAQFVVTRFPQALSTSTGWPSPINAAVQSLAHPSSPFPTLPLPHSSQAAKDQDQDRHLRKISEADRGPRQHTAHQQQH